MTWKLAGPCPRRQPVGTGFPQVVSGQLLVFRRILPAQHFPPPAVCAFVDEGLGAAIPEDAAEWCALGRMLFHIVETAVFENGSPCRLLDGDVQEIGDAPDFPRHVLLQTGEMDQADIRQVTDLPPRLDV